MNITQVVSHGMGDGSKQVASGVEKAIYSVSWGGVENPTLTRTDDAVDMAAVAGVGSEVVVNDFDSVDIFANTEEVDEYGNVFRRIPKCYIKKTNSPWVRAVSRYQHSGYYLPKCFWDFVNGVELDYIDVGAYNASLSDDGTKLESKSGKSPLVNKNIVEFRDYAEANGTAYYQLDVHVYDLLQTLFYIEFATLGSQSIARGFVDGRYSSSDLATVTESGTNRVIVANATAAYYDVGQTISVGTSQGGNQIFYGRTITSIDVYDGSNMAISFDGAVANIVAGNYLYNTGQISGWSSVLGATSGRPTGTDGKQSCCYRGIENPWGSLWQFVDGVNINDNQAWVCDNPTDYASNLFASPYEQLSYVNHNVNGYFVEAGHDADHPDVSLPISVTGGDYNKYYCDYYYRAAGQRIAVVGGDWGSGSFAGLSSWHLHGSASYAFIYFGGRLLKAAL